MSDKSSDMNKTQVFTTGPKAVLIITPDGRLEAGEGLSNDEVSRELFKLCSTYYGTRTAELERENAALNHALNIAQTELRLNGCAKAADEVAKLHDAARKEAQP